MSGDGYKTTPPPGSAGIPACGLRSVSYCRKPAGRDACAPRGGWSFCLFCPFCFLLIPLLEPSPGGLPGIYVTPKGSPNGNGTPERPLDLATALSNRSP